MLTYALHSLSGVFVTDASPSGWGAVLFADDVLATGEEDGEGGGGEGGRGYSVVSSGLTYADVC
jgi:hypothetical protein